MNEIEKTTEPNPASPISVSEEREPADYVVAIGTSAGGVETLTKLFESMPENDNAYVIVQHMSPDFKTMLPEILTRSTQKNITLAYDGALLSKGSIYLFPPNKMMTVFDGRLRLTDRKEGDPKSFFPIDHFLESLAKEYGTHAVVLILSGTGTDGVRGTQIIQTHSGFVIVQSPDSAKFPGMPKSVIAAKSTNAIVKVEEMCSTVLSYTHNMGVVGKLSQSRTADVAETSLARIFVTLRNQFGIDFSFYNDELVTRRIERRIRITDSQNIEEYSQRVAFDVLEANSLRDDLLLGATEFYRDPESLDRLAAEFFPILLAKANSKEPIRAWVVGCSTGEEAFTLAFMFDQFLVNQKSLVQFKIFATDVDEKAIRIASRASYPTGGIANLPEPWREKYFTTFENQSTVKAAIREKIVFAVHNVLSDAPFPHIDLIVCRNLLIYFKQEAKNIVFRGFQFSLQDSGLLLLGPTETAPPESKAFAEKSSESKIFECIQPKKNMKEKLVSNLSPSHIINETALKKEPELLSPTADIYKILIESHFPSSLVVDDDNQVIYYFGKISEFLQPLSGKASHHLKSIVDKESYSMITELKDSLTSDTRSASSILFLESTNGAVTHIDIEVRWIAHIGGGRNYFLVKMAHVPQSQIANTESLETFQLLSRIRSYAVKLSRTQKELEESNSKMNSVISQLEVSNEELRSTNEELQSGTEELQTTNEELQAVNEELYTVNAECQLRIEELSEMSNDVHNIYEVSEIGTLFVDKNLRVRKYNKSSQKIFSLLPDDIGRPINHFSSSLKVDFAFEIRSVLANLKMFQKEIVSNDGQNYLMRIAPYKTDDLTVKGAVLIFIEITPLKKVEQELTVLKDDLCLLKDKIDNFILLLDNQFNILEANRPFCEVVDEISPEALRGKSLLGYFAKDDALAISHKIRTLSVGQQHSTDAKATLVGASNQFLSTEWHFESRHNVLGVYMYTVAIGRTYKKKT